jgi:hypothetical protein
MQNIRECLAGAHVSSNVEDAILKVQMGEYTLHLDMEVPLGDVTAIQV